MTHKYTIVLPDLPILQTIKTLVKLWLVFRLERDKLRLTFSLN